MDKLFQSIAFVLQAKGERSRLLLRWRPSAKCWGFIVAERLNKESFRESVTREVAWQLDLNRKSDFLVSNMAQLSMEYVEDADDGSQRHVAVAFYNVHLFRKSAVESVSNDSANRWTNAREVCAGETKEGQAIDPQVVSWINKWGVVQPWQ